MMVDHPVYRVAWGANPAVIEGKAGVLAFYNSVGEAVLWNSDDLICGRRLGRGDELTFNQLAHGADLQAIGYDAPKADGLYHVASRQAFIWPYDSQARLAGEHLYEDKTSLKIEEVDPVRRHHAGASPRNPQGVAGQAGSRARRQILGAWRLTSISNSGEYSCPRLW